MAQNIRMEPWSKLNKIQKKITLSRAYMVVFFPSKLRAQACVNPTDASGLIPYRTFNFTREMADLGQPFLGVSQVAIVMHEKLMGFH